MTATTHPNFNANTEALEVAAAFPQAIRGKTVVVTGVNLKGIGFTTAQAFASQDPAHLIVAGRNKSKLEECITEIKRDYPNVDYRELILELSSQESVRAAAQELLSWKDVPMVNILVNSAGVASIPERTLTEEGIELTFATNHVGHFLFTNLIKSKLIEAAKANPKGATRIVNVSSGATEGGGMRWSDVNFAKKSKDLPQDEQPNEMILKAWGVQNASEKSYIPIQAYIQSKAANTLFSIGLTSRAYDKYGILSVATHPGVIETELSRNSSKEQKEQVKEMQRKGMFTYKTLGAGSSTSLVAALDPKLQISETKDGKEGYGAYLKDCQISQDAHPLSKSDTEAEKLWELSEKLVKENFSW